MNNLKIANFNISGGFYIGNEDTEYLDREAAEHFDDRLLNQIIDVINNEQIDIICFQEIITSPEIAYIEKIVNKTNLKHFESFELSPCNIVKNTNCGIAILSKFPITSVKKDLFPNPKIAKTTASGKTYYTYDKGYMIAEIKADKNPFKILTHHGFPYRRFNSSPEQNKPVFEHFNNVLLTEKPNIVTGDFNAENFTELIDCVNKNYKRTINQITTVDGKSFDDILIEKSKNFDSKLVKLLSDHFIVITTLK